VNAAEAFVATLRAAEVGMLFGLPGSTEAALLEALRTDGGLRYVLALHENAAVAMADGYARASGRVGVVGLHTSVGTMNGMSQIYNAYHDRSPVVVTAGHKDRQVLAEDGFCALPELAALLRGFTKWSWQSLSAEAVASDLARALRVAVAPPPGPTYLAVPEDLMAAPLPGAEALPAVWPIPAGPPRELARRPDAESVKRAAVLMLSARQPLLLVGSAAAGAAPLARALAEMLEMPVVSADRTDLSILPYPVSDMRYLGQYGEESEALKDCDCVVAIGCRLFFPFSDRTRPYLPPGARVVHVYPEAERVGWSVRPDIGLAADVAPALQDLAAAVASLGGLGTAERTGRAAHVAALARKRGERLRAERAAAENSMPVSIPHFAMELGRVLPPDAIVMDEAVRSSRQILAHCAFPEGSTVYRTTGGSLGWGVPAAIGAKLAQPKRPVLALVGDGSFQFTAQATWTAVREAAGIVTIVLDNGGYLAVKRAIERHVGQSSDPRPHPGTALPGLDHAAVAAGYGARSTVVRHSEELAPTITAALAADAPAVIVVPVEEARR
jgi:benzoylformate decarboxylase